MALSAENIARARQQVKEIDAKRVSLSYDPKIGRITAVRKWKVNQDVRSIVLEYLDTYGYDRGTDTPGVPNLDSLNIPTPQIDDQAHPLPETYRVIQNQDGGAADPGYVYQTIRKINQPTTVATLAALKPLKTQEEAIVRPFGFTSGKKWDVAYVFYDIDPAKKAVLEGLTASSTTPTVPTLERDIAGAGWTYVDRKFQEQEDNTAVFVILFQKVEWSKTWADKRTVAEQNPNDTRENTRTREVGGVSEANLSDQYIAAKVAETGWVVEAASQADAGDGERVVRSVEGAVLELADGASPTAAASLTISITPDVGVKDGTATRRWKRVSQAYKDALVLVGGLARIGFTITEDNDTVAYYHRGVDITDHGNGVYTVTQTGQSYDYAVADVYVDVRGKAVYYKEPSVSDVVTANTIVMWVRWPIYRTYHVFRSTWNNCWLACKSKRGGVDGTHPVGTYPIVGAISVGAFGEFMFHGQVTTFRGWTAWALAEDVDALAEDADAGASE